VKSKVSKVILVVCLVKSGGSSTAFYFSGISDTPYSLDRFTQIQRSKLKASAFNLPEFFTLYSIHSDFLQESDKPAFDLHGIVTGRDCVVFGLYDLIDD